MPLIALLPPTTLPTITVAVLFRNSGLGSDWKFQVLAALGLFPPQTVCGGSNPPVAYSIWPYSMTRTVSGRSIDDWNRQQHVQPR